MKYFLASILLLNILLASCTNNEVNKATVIKADKIAKKPIGTIMAADSVRVKEEKLNHFYFTVKIKTTEYSNTGTYDAVASWGNAQTSDMFTLPRAGVPLIPEIRKTDTPYTYIIGFRYGDNQAFYDYYIVQGHPNEIDMKYFRAYSFK